MVKKKMITLEASEELKEALRLAAFKKKVSVSALIRQILEKSLETELKELGENDQGAR